MGAGSRRGEVRSWSQGDRRLLQSTVTEGLGIEPCGGYVEVDVEGTIG